MAEIFGVKAKYITCPCVLEEKTIRHDQYGNSERYMKVRYMVMSEDKIWYWAIGEFNSSDFPDREETWKPTHWLSLERMPPL